ncbi:putative membrane protein YeaQ/YmgE (transglycosylase-associated protein family) [Geomicrobium halophilum]|uniref:Putative membrane protein YeaQ/YmgE (Transglycosylase-associated protein family) n=1 Tax=Geomicrobium halophilum TaxID=549000 RepID=A0A841Q0F5_9BACL|nr:GlsB/YeaQ/YmgE family stress response membrane protein [Geomicrobium halophilum]MBB6451143.1 putative membrane protein YeaQ/YmgE (transglycosylase-associated protein family) [Geomicrobium halophilum]
MLSFIWSLIIGGLIGWAAGAITGKGVPFGIIGNIVAGFIGANLGTWLFGNWGWTLGGFAVFPALIGAIILVLIVSAITNAMKK